MNCLGTGSGQTSESDPSGHHLHDLGPEHPMVQNADSFSGVFLQAFIRYHTVGNTY